jgi:hypothetical protein
VADNSGFASGEQTWTAYASGGEFAEPTAITPPLVFQPFESNDLRNWTPLAEPVEGDGALSSLMESGELPRNFYRTLEYSPRSYREASWSSDFPDDQLSAGMTLVRANPSVSWDLSPGLLELTNSVASSVAGMVRRPGGYALAPGDWRNMTLTVEAQSLEAASVANRDICLISGYQDDTHFYYAHLSQRADNSFHTIIMKVTGNSRDTIHTPIATGVNAGPITSSLENPIFQTLRVSHRATGEISVFVDEMTDPVMTANDTTYPVGRVGAGTFDDKAVFRALSVTGERP